MLMDLHSLYGFHPSAHFTSSAIGSQHRQLSRDSLLITLSDRLILANFMVLVKVIKSFAPLTINLLSVIIELSTFHVKLQLRRKTW